jgi:hypothetical protein
MLRSWLVQSTLIASLAAVPTAYAGHEDFHARFSGFNEVGALNNETGAIFSQGKGNLTLRLDRTNHMITFSLNYSGLTSAVTQAHIHFGKKHVPGGVLVFFCTNAGNAPAGIPPCPAGGGTVTGTITAANVLAITGQNVTAGDFDALEDAIRSETAYGNIHTTKFPAGEIRGEIRRGQRDDD